MKINYWLIITFRAKPLQQLYRTMYFFSFAHSILPTCTFNSYDTTLRLNVHHKQKISKDKKESILGSLNTPRALRSAPRQPLNRKWKATFLRPQYKTLYTPSYTQNIELFRLLLICAVHTFHTHSYTHISQLLIHLLTCTIHNSLYTFLNAFNHSSRL